MGRLRISLAHRMIRAGKAIESLALMVMRPDDLAAFSRSAYEGERNLKTWSAAGVLAEGLDREEEELLEACPVRRGRLLLLGLGGGREAIPLAQRGYEVTGVDFVAEMVEQAKTNAARYGVKLEGLVQELSLLDVPPGSFDVVWFSARMYSCVPGRPRRVAMLQRIARALRPGGVCVCQFHWDRRPRMSVRMERWHRALAYLTLGYWRFERGDMLWANREFLHAFDDEAALRAEFDDGGFEVLHWKTSDEMLRGAAVLRRK